MVKFDEDTTGEHAEMASYEMTMAEVVELIIQAKRRNTACCLLVGAGCSASAGIPIANEVIELIRKEYRTRVDRAKCKTYSEYMAILTPAERRHLLGECIDNAPVNWAHMCIALLVKSGYVDRVLTTNFDPLIIKACAMLEQFPAVYDIASSDGFDGALISSPSVFYLHGQRTGFTLLNTPADFRNYASHVAPVIDDTAQNHVWIVAGYSGKNDPAFDHLAGIRSFDQGLLWVGYRDDPPADHVEARLLGWERNSFFVSGYDADSFFITLTRGLGLFPPELVTKPFTYLENVLSKLTPFKLPRYSTEERVAALPLHYVHQAALEYEPVTDVFNDCDPDKAAMVIQKAVMAGNYTAALSLRSLHDRYPEAEALARALSWAYVAHGDAIMAKVGTESGTSATELYQQAAEQYQAASLVYPSRVETYCRWGHALVSWAQAAPTVPLLMEAVERLQQAIRLDHRNTNARSNLAIAFVELAKLDSGSKRDANYQQAHEVLERVEEIEPGSASYNLACLSALLGDEHGCEFWLERAHEKRNLPKRAAFMTDPDLASVSGAPWFKNFVERAYPRRPTRSKRPRASLAPLS